MRITIDMGTPGWRPGRIPRWARPLVLVLTLAIGVPAVLANDAFVDVPVGVHHDDVTKLATAGITVGCGVDVSNNSLFCPGQPVTREQMATFLVRGLPRIAEDAWIDEASTTYPQAVVQIDAGMPAAATASTGYLKVDAYATFDSADERNCQVTIEGTMYLNGFYFSKVPAGADPYSSAAAMNPVQHLPSLGEASVALTDVLEVQPGAYELQLLAYARSGSEVCTATVNGHVTVMYVPFDGNANNDSP